MYFITGDTHRDFCRVEAFCNSVVTSKEDVSLSWGTPGSTASAGAGTGI